MDYKASSGDTFFKVYGGGGGSNVDFRYVIDCGCRKSAKWSFVNGEHSYPKMSKEVLVCCTKRNGI